jgi:hypothetical protein
LAEHEDSCFDDEFEAMGSLSEEEEVENEDEFGEMRSDDKLGG